ncbi:hypothetical protein RHGRI_033199 [Rhododendron griersonianum]|uniref:Jacalin-type lectin domain-containing protein n=1 Tax=Rhododendron griersonianum TaxID=479676 RepID=A0AAV6HWP9_9ERIC|nr:hypothetical protein RHGRI_033199 [Rhododendron griersonianum]
MEIWEFLMWVVPAVVSVIQAIRQPIVEDVIHRSIDALCGFVSRELGRLWRQKKPEAAPVLLDQGRALKIDIKELKTEIKELKNEIKELEAKNEALRKRNEVMEKRARLLVKEGIPRGPWGGNVGAYWAYKSDIAPIMQITLRYGSVIDSISIKSKSCDGNVIGSSQRFGGPYGHNSVTFRIDSSIEQLSSISLTYGHFNGERTIASLCFYSNQDTYGPFGSVQDPDDPPVSIPIEDDVVLAGFHGRAGNYLNAIGKRKYAPFGGNKIGTYFSSTLSSGKAVGFFFGRSGSYLPAIGVHMDYL